MPRQNNPKIGYKRQQGRLFLLHASENSTWLAKPLSRPQSSEADATLVEPPRSCDPEPILPSNPRAISPEWTPEQQSKLYRLHNDLGNKWTVISREFTGRSDNSIKNHFFSKLRMSVRHLNKKLSERDLVGKPRTVKMHVLYKIMSVCQERFKQDSPYTQEFIEFSYNLKNQILNYLDHYQEKPQNYIEKIAKDIHIFSHKFRLRSSESRKNTQSRIPSKKKDAKSNEEPSVDLEFEEALEEAFQSQKIQQKHEQGIFYQLINDAGASKLEQQAIPTRLALTEDSQHSHIHHHKQQHRELIAKAPFFSLTDPLFTDRLLLSDHGFYEPEAYPYVDSDSEMQLEIGSYRYFQKLRLQLGLNNRYM